MKHPLVKWLLPILRYGLCLVAFAYLYFNVSWFDTIQLVDRKQPVRLIEEGADSFLIEIDGRRDKIGHETVVHIPETGEPVVNYGLRRVLGGMDRNQALLAVLLFGPVPFFSALRLVWMLAIQDVKLAYWNAVKLTFAGNFFNFALPGSTGGDLYKAYYITRFTHHKTEAVTTIFLDRVVGLLGLVALASFMMAITWTKLDLQPAFRNAIAGMLLSVWSGLIVGAVFVFSKRLRHAIGLPKLAEKLPGGAQLIRIGRATVAMRRHPTLMGMSLLLTVLLQLLVVFSAFYLARSIDMRGSFQLYFICVAIGFLIAAIPITPPQGLGVVEYAYVKFFAGGGLNHASAAVAFALAVRLIQLVWAVPGVLVPLLGAPRPSAEELRTLGLSDDADAAGNDSFDEAEPTDKDESNRPPGASP